MTAAPGDRGREPPAPSARRPRWQRFSPSMGWPAFWSEILIVVLGVAIALAAGEALEEWNWRTKVEDAEVRLQGDITWAFLWAAEKLASQPCVDAQLAALGERVRNSGEVLDPIPVLPHPDLQVVVRMPFRPYRFPVWDALLADGTASHFGTGRQALYGRISDGMEASRANEMESRHVGGYLLLMRDPIPLDPGVRAALLTHINTLRSMTAYEGVNAQQRMRVVDDAGLAPPDEVVERFLNASGEHPSGADFSGTIHFCMAQGLPVRDWRDYRKLPALHITYPGAPTPR